MPSNSPDPYRPPPPTALNELLMGHREAGDTQGSRRHIPMGGLWEYYEFASVAKIWKTL